MIFEIKDALASKSKHKLTISPSEKRVTVKIALESTSEERDRVVSFYRAIYEKIGFSCEQSMRGSTKVGKNDICLYNDSKSKTLHFKISDFKWLDIN
jgi:hypothetical protein